MEPCWFTPGCWVSFRNWITKNGERVYRENGRPWPIHSVSGCPRWVR